MEKGRDMLAEIADGENRRDVKQCKRCAWLCVILKNGKKEYLCEKDPVYEVKRKVVFVSLKKFKALDRPPDCVKVKKSISTAKPGK